MADESWPNPMGTDGFEFVEYTAPDPAALVAVLERMGCVPVARHRSKQVTLYRQGGINFIVNAEPQSFAQAFARLHGPSACAMAFRVRDAAKAYARAIELGAKGVAGKIGPMELNIPAIEGIGGSLLYLVDRYGDRTIYDVDFVPLPGAGAEPQGVGFARHRPSDAQRPSRPHGGMGALLRAALRLPRDPLFRHRGPAHRPSLQGDDEPVRQDPHPDQRERRRQVADRRISRGLSRRGHSAHRARRRATSTRRSRRCSKRGVKFMSVPDTYYERIDARLPGHGEDLARLRRDRILIDGAPGQNQGEKKLLLQIFTETVIGPIFFEIIERKGDEGFGEGNFQALFESMELDQMRRGVLKT